MCSNSHTGGGRRECAADSEWRQIKKSAQIANLFDSSYPQLVHTLLISLNLSTGYPQPGRVIHRSGPTYPQLIHKLSTNVIGDIFRNWFAWIPHLTPNSDSWIGKSRSIINSILCHTIYRNWFAHVLTNWITPTVLAINSHTLTHIALITHDRAYSHTSSRASSK